MRFSDWNKLIFTRKSYCQQENKVFSDSINAADYQPTVRILQHLKYCLFTNYKQMAHLISLTDTFLAY